MQLELMRLIVFLLKHIKFGGEAWEIGSWIRCCEGGRGGLINVVIMFGTCLFEDPGALCVDILRRLP